LDVRRALAKAAEEQNHCAYSLILQAYLTRIGLTPPKGVFRRNLIARAGRPRSEEGFAVWVAMMQMQRNSSGNQASFGMLAKKVFPEKF
jgi:hypothetical protein